MRRISRTVVLAALGLLAPAASAAGGLTPVAPKHGDVLTAGERPAFTLTVRGKGQVWVRVCTSRRKNRVGLICRGESIGRAHRTDGRRFTYRPRFYDYPDFWLNSPGTYYWQAYRIACENGLEDCRIEGPVVKFKVE
jgi:hypothetical protein